MRNQAGVAVTQPKWVLAPKSPTYRFPCPERPPAETGSKSSAALIRGRGVCVVVGLRNRQIISVHRSWDREWWLMTHQSLFQRLSQPLQKESALSPQLRGSYHLSSHTDQKLKLKKQLDSYQSS